MPVLQLTVSTIIQALSLGPVARWNVNNDDFSVTTEYYSQYSPHLLLLPGLATTRGTPGGGGWPASWSRGHEAGVSKVCPRCVRCGAASCSGGGDGHSSAGRLLLLSPPARCLAPTHLVSTTRPGSWTQDFLWTRIRAGLWNTVGLWTDTGFCWLIITALGQHDEHYRWSLGNCHTTPAPHLHHTG